MRHDIMGWYTLGEEWVHCSAKAGSQSLLVAILEEHGMHDPGFGFRRELVHRWLVDGGAVEHSYEPPPGERLRVQYVRDPVERFLSLYKDKVLGKGDGVPLALHRMKTPDELLDYIQRFPYANRHWAPQSIATPYADRVYPLEDFPVKSHETVVPEADDVSFDLYRLMQVYLTDYVLYDFHLA